MKDDLYSYFSSEEVKRLLIEEFRGCGGTRFLKMNFSECAAATNEIFDDMDDELFNI